MKRDIYKSLSAWKLSTRRKPLILEGARQVGKTHALKTFGATEYENVAYFNFEKDERLKNYFGASIDPKKILQTLSIHAAIDIEPGKTLIIFDEIQECPRSLNSLKYFCEEANEYHIAAAGSLLGVKISRKDGFPVGQVNFLHLYPLTFFEFLTASGHKKLRAYLDQLDEPTPIPFHEELLELLRFYLFVGGMPEVVAYYVNEGKLDVVRDIQLEILQAYEKDFAKHAPANEVIKITTVWKQIHRQLAKENKKFIFSAIRQSARSRDYEIAIQWLVDAGLIHKSYRIEVPKLPLDAYAQTNIFKLFALDVGLLGAQSALSPKTVIDKSKIFTEFKGALTESFIAQELVARGDNGLYYWMSEGQAELDFLTESNGKVHPLEVKSGSNNRKKSLLVYGEKYQSQELSRATTNNFKKDGKITNYPLYLVQRINRLQERSAEL